MKAGAVEFLTKPVEPEALFASVGAGLALDRQKKKQNADSVSLRKRYESLTPREREVPPLVASGLRKKQAAATLGISEFTLHVHRGQVMRKMCASSFADLVRMASALAIQSPFVGPV